MRTGTTFIVGLVTLFSFILPSLFARVAPNKRPEMEQLQRQHAEELWEKAIAAKGGREKLHSIHNMLVVQDFEYWVHPFKRARNLLIDFVVLPDKAWSWYDQRPGKFGLQVSMINSDRNLYWLTYPDDPDSPRRLVTENTDAGMIFHQLIELMETRWMKPIPLASTTRRLGSKRVEVVRVRAEPHEVNYYLDPKTHLPLRVEFFKVNQADDRPRNTIDLFDYVEVDGIQMPSKIRGGDSAKIPHAFRFNVEYNKELFEVPPTVEAGPNAWQPKKHQE